MCPYDITNFHTTCKNKVWNSGRHFITCFQKSFFIMGFQKLIENMLSSTFLKHMYIVYNHSKRHVQDLMRSNFELSFIFMTLGEIQHLFLNGLRLQLYWHKEKWPFQWGGYYRWKVLTRLSLIWYSNSNGI